MAVQRTPDMHLLTFLHYQTRTWKQFARFAALILLLATAYRLSGVSIDEATAVAIGRKVYIMMLNRFSG